MPKTLSFWPAGRTVPPTAGPVRRRHVIHVHGYDPDADRRARTLFVRELGRYAKRFGLMRSVSPPIRDAAIPSTTWQIEASNEDGRGRWATDITFEVLVWDDIVRVDFKRSVALRIALLAVGVAEIVLSGDIVRLFRVNWKFGGIILYPVVVIALLLAMSLGLGFLVAGAVERASALGSPWTGLVALGVALAAFSFAAPRLERFFVWHLLHDWVFNWQHGHGWRPDYEARVDRFAERLAAIVRTSDADEILVVGHSSGVVMAIETTARALARLPDLPAGRVSLLTLGTCLPIVALARRARRCHAALRTLMTDPAVLWVEYQAPQDWLNFAGFNPARDMPTGRRLLAPVNPVIRSAQFRATMLDEEYRSVLFRPFRMHFQYLMANGRAGEYDYFDIVLGPEPLGTRVADAADGRSAWHAGHGASERPQSAELGPLQDVLTASPARPGSVERLS